jgi:hypothetical protein
MAQWGLPAPETSSDSVRKKGSSLGAPVTVSDFLRRINLEYSRYRPGCRWTIGLPCLDRTIAAVLDAQQVVRRQEPPPWCRPTHVSWVDHAPTASSMPARSKSACLVNLSDEIRELDRELEPVVRSVGSRRDPSAPCPMKGVHGEQ